MTRILLSLVILAVGAGEASAQASAMRKAARELVQFLKKPFAREVMEEGAENLEGRFARVMTRHGDDVTVAAAARRMGPRTALRIVEQHGLPGAKILVRFGDDGARLLTTDAARTMTVFRNLGEEGVDLMLKRRGTTSARLPELAAAIKASGRPSEVLAVLRKYGDPACDFIWKNKGVLAGGALLAAFLANPTPYINGVTKLVDVPMSHIAAATDWTAVFLAMIVIAAGIASFRMFVLRRSAPRPSQA
ncbi:MAG TPA: hypothetical protein VFS19_06855 [Planctomycetota bacterium]|nr:hypothetical protein [Planctomycetota bacterium]